MYNDTVLAKIQSAQRILSEVKSVSDAKHVIGLAEAATMYAKRIGASRDVVNGAAEVRLRAERRLGEILRDTPKNRGGEHMKVRSTTGSKAEPVVTAPTLADIGIDKKLSARAQVLAAAPEGIFEGAIQRGMEGDLIPSKVAKELRNAVRRKPTEKATVRTTDTEKVVDLASLVSAGRKFGCVYADPPWPYANQATRSSTSNHYSTMTLEQICELPIGQLAADVAYLHLWTTNAFLFDAKTVMDAWGFTYKSVLVWCKPQMGIGNYWRVSHEFLLLGVKGSRSFPDGARNVKSWMEVERGRHSAKPEVFRQVVERVSPGPFLELFGRHTCPGWTVWGNQVEELLYDAKAV